MNEKVKKGGISQKKRNQERENRKIKNKKEEGLREENKKKEKHDVWKEKRESESSSDFQRDAAPD